MWAAPCPLDRRGDDRVFGSFTVTGASSTTPVAVSVAGEPREQGGAYGYGPRDGKGER
ncbi:hypothetical protein [Streptomyces malaysiense]|uniref:hypothetical protein n=1 Tax=Streptomyces malaysiense TaxID=1428626 RepID=UPI000AE00B27|nr:hypothetical protein [Streptomyces malaysiense]